MNIEIKLNVQKKLCDSCPLVYMSSEGKIYFAACLLFKKFIVQSTRPLKSEDMERLDACCTFRNSQNGTTITI